MDNDPSRDVDWNASSARTKLARRRVERIAWIAFAVVFVVPGLLFFLGSLAPAGGVFAVLLTLPMALFSFLFPIVVLLILLTGIGYAIYGWYNPVGRPDIPRDGTAATPIAGTASSRPVPASALTLLDGLRGETQGDARRRMRMFIPVGLGIAALLFWLMMSSGGRWHMSPGVVLLTMLALGAAGGWFMAVARPGKRYATSFKQTLIPPMLGRFGELTYSQGGPVDVSRLVETGILPRYSRIEVDDMISGTYRGTTVSIVEVTLRRFTGRRLYTEFHGLIVSIAVKPHFGFTAVVSEGKTGEPLPFVQFDEDAAFAEMYSVFGSDPPAIRDMLGPEARHALMTMADGKGFHPPLLLCEGGTMTAAIESSDWRDLLEPSRLATHDAGTQASLIEGELAAIFGLVDDLLELHLPFRDNAPDFK